MTLVASKQRNRGQLRKPVLILLLVGLVGCEATDRSAPARPGASDAGSEMVGWWQFEEGSGNTVADSSGSGNTATIYDGGWSSGRSGAGLQMNGGNDSIVVVPVSESLKSTGDAITVMAWTYRTAEHNVAVVAHNYPALFFGFHGPQFKWQIRSTGSFLTRAVRKLGPIHRITRSFGYPPPSEAACYVEPIDPAVLDRWIHVAGTFDGSRARLYVDGIEICDQPFPGPIGMSDAPFTISGYLDEVGDIVDEITGKLDDVRVYGRALSETEIRAVYAEGVDSAPLLQNGDRGR
jgi:hypothetical protein